ncbi:N-acetyltransferase [Dysgonomonas sp. 511]|uniref:GNAT family N-acetyltransferase n=1 Tax=Dysgonomonas sp. 511 TaxID=2302930 RepID=UPI0013D68319|nr:GNAT family N-acetyltransferase [Dysgonomonas sp. 511]NDV79789.1 N-acetyltransferase [Dysgonomonas sp. 511]
MENRMKSSVVISTEEVSSNPNDLYLRLAYPEDYAAICAIQDEVMAELIKNNDKNLFIPTENSKIREYLEREDVLFLCGQTSDTVGAYAYTFFGSDIECDLSCHFDYQQPVATFDTVVVRGKHRGNGIHAKLLRLSITEAVLRGCSIMAATVDPNNVHSLNNFLKSGFKVLKTIDNEEGYSGYKRYIVYKILSKEEVI